MEVQGLDALLHTENETTHEKNFVEGPHHGKDITSGEEPTVQILVVDACVQEDRQTSTTNITTRTHHAIEFANRIPLSVSQEVMDMKEA